MKKPGIVIGLVAGSALSIVVATIFTAEARKARDAAEVSACHGCFTGIGTAMRHYYDGQGHYPPAFVPDKDGKPAHSWRVLLLAYIDPLTFAAYRFDEPWNGQNNRKLEDKMPSCYVCPADKQGREKWQTNYFVVVGPNTAFPGSKTVKLGDITRPHNETILIVESINQGVHWMEPKDLTFEEMSFAINDRQKPSVSSYHKRAPGAYMVDGTMLWLTDVKPKELREKFLITPDRQE